MRFRVRPTTVLGVASIAIGVGAMIYAHVGVAPDLQRTEDVVRRLVADTAFAVGELQRAAEATDAVRLPTEDATRRSVAALDPGLAMLDALAGTLRAIPGTDTTAASGVGRASSGSDDDARRGTAGLGTSLARLERAVTDAAADVRALRHASLVMESATERHPLPSFQPTLATVAARVDETQAILADTRPARGITLLFDLIAGMYVMLGAGLLVVHRGP